MLMPRMTTANLIDELFDDFWNFDDSFRRAERRLYGRHADRLMSTDVREKDGSYQMDMDLPGFTKDEVQISLENGYLTVTAAKGLDKEDDSRFIRRERYAGSCSRTFYVGDTLTPDKIKAAFHHGILTLDIPKEEPVPAVEQKKFIEIEG